MNLEILEFQKWKWQRECDENSKLYQKEERSDEETDIVELLVRVATMKIQKVTKTTELKKIIIKYRERVNI